jgi:hypothetical protein
MFAVQALAHSARATNELTMRNVMRPQLKKWGSLTPIFRSIVLNQYDFRHFFRPEHDFCGPSTAAKYFESSARLDH